MPLSDPYRILVCDPVDTEGLEMLKKAGCLVDVVSDLSIEELKAAIPSYDVLIVRSRTKVTSELIAAGDRLKIIGRAGAGLDNIDLEEAEKRNVIVLNTPEAVSDAVAELTVGLMITLVRRISEADRLMKEGVWAKKRLKGTQLKGKTLGLIGLGRIGLRVARLARAFGMRILVTKRTPPSEELMKELGGRFVTLEKLLKSSDIVSLHVPLTEETRYMIREKELNLMKKGALLINTSRGGLIDHDALIRALASGKLGGVALDVYEKEPPVNLELLKFQNVICTPHIGAQTREAQREASILLAKKILEKLKLPSAL